MIEKSQVSKSTPFDNTTNGFVSTNAQEAIEEAKATAPGTQSGFVRTFAYSGNAASGRWLESFDGTPTNDVGFLANASLTLTGLAISGKAGSTYTGTIQIKKNGVNLTTITLTAQRQNYVTGLAFSLVAGDEISAQLSSGSVSTPVLELFLRTA